MELTSERCPVTRSVLGVGRLADAGCAVVFAVEGGYIVKCRDWIPQDGGHIRRTSGLYSLDCLERPGSQTELSVEPVMGCAPQSMSKNPAVLVVVESNSGLARATCTPRTGAHAFTMNNFRQCPQQRGHQDCVIRGYGEPALQSLLRCVKQLVGPKVRVDCLLAAQISCLLCDALHVAGHDLLAPDRLLTLVVRHIAWLLSHFHIRSDGTDVEEVVTGVRVHGKLA